MREGNRDQERRAAAALTIDSGQLQSISLLEEASVGFYASPESDLSAW